MLTFDTPEESIKKKKHDKGDNAVDKHCLLFPTMFSNRSMEDKFNVLSKICHLQMLSVWTGQIVTIWQRVD